MKLLLAALVSALFVTSACRAQSRQTGDQSKISAEEYAVYAAMIGDMFAGDKVAFDTQEKVMMIVIEDRTVNRDFAGENVTERLKQIFSPPIPQEIIDDFAAKNAKSHQLTNSLDLKLKYTLIPKEKINQIFDGLPSSEFYKQFPHSGGYIALSRAGFNASGDQALAYMAHVCGGLCGSGHYLLLAKKNGEWAVQKKFRAWIS